MKATRTYIKQFWFIFLPQDPSLLPLANLEWAVINDAKILKFNYNRTFNLPDMFVIFLAMGAHYFREIFCCSKDNVAYA